jgi:bifunctional UDP-N-acetylglucosamine pyrophosphorylase/glucosamine-1-phosphate N-acetyltransferase
MLKSNDLAEGAYIDPLAVVNGYVKLGKNSYIGRNCTINGNIIVGDDTVIDNGAIIDGFAMVGDRAEIKNYCYITGGSTIGNQCKVLHGAEFFGTLFDHCYLYHYMEIDGLLGFNVDIGAACVCGTLRFDEKSSSVVVKGHRTTPRNFANATYIGDYTRTGVNCTFMPGVRVGIYCAIGPTAYITEDVPDRTLLLVKQEHILKPWGPEKYGW